MPSTSKSSLLYRRRPTSISALTRRLVVPNLRTFSLRHLFSRPIQKAELP